MYMYLFMHLVEENKRAFIAIFIKSDVLLALLHVFTFWQCIIDHMPLQQS